MKESFEGITIKREDNFTEWFVQLMQKADLADYSKVSGCIILKPTAWEIWEKIKSEVDKGFKKIGIKNCAFPLFIPESLLTKEEEHVEGFAPEVAWVDYGGNTKLGERLAVRPTSEAIMYDSYSKWIRSYKELPLLLNQWNNVVRWEFKNPVPFFRTREFFWNEAHTAFANRQDALKHGKKVMKVYKNLTENFMALAGIYGRKTEKEKFAGAVFSEKVHHYLPNGKVIEGSCFHYDGENFAKAYDIKFQDEKSKERYVHQNTHAISTRMLGTMFATHSDNKGLVLPPKLAPNKVVIIPLLFKGKEAKVIKSAEKIYKDLKKYSALLDKREDISPGRKFNEWELKGIPIRIELGPRDLEKNSVMVLRRDTLEKTEIKIKDLVKKIPEILKDIQNNLFEKSKESLNKSFAKTDSKEKMIELVKNKKMVLVPMCKKESCEETLKEETNGGKTLFIDSSKKDYTGKKCVICEKPANYWVYVGKTY